MTRRAAGKEISRRDILAGLAGLTVSAVTLPGCRGAAPQAGSRGPGRRRLHIAQASHPVPGYDDWFDRHAANWGAEHDVDVTIDRLPVGRLPEVAAAEVAAGRGHDLFGFLGPPAAFDDHVTDHRLLVEEAEERHGALVPLVRQTISDPRTGKLIGFSDSWAPSVALWRSDLWAATGTEPDSWDEILRAAPGLKAAGHPVGIGFSQDLDSNTALLSLMAGFGAFVQDDQSRVTLDRPETVTAVEFARELFRAGMTREVFAWDALSNNRFLEAGRGSLILNPISALRTIERNNPELARNIRVSPAPRGPARRIGMSGAVSIYVIWEFARHKQIAGRFLVDLAGHSRDLCLHSRFTNLPAFSGVEVPVGDLAARLAGAADWSANVGYPGYSNPAVAEVVNRSLVPQMFARATGGSARAAEAVRDAAAEVEAIYQHWRDRGRI